MLNTLDLNTYRKDADVMEKHVQIKTRNFWKKMLFAGSAALMMNVINVNAQSTEIAKENEQVVYSHEDGFYRDPLIFASIDEALEYGRSNFDSEKHIEFYVNLDPEGYYVIDWEMKPSEDDDNEIPEEPSPEEPDQQAHIHTVQSGEYLWLIAEYYGVTVDQLIEWNQLESNFLYVGQELLVVAPEQEPEEPVEEFLVHDVKAGESLWLIAENYGVTVADLIEWNQLESNFLYVGQELIVGLK